MDGVATAVLGIEGDELSEEVMHFLDRTGETRVVATAQDSRQLLEAIRQLDPDLVIASSAIASATDRVKGRVLFCLDTAESVRGLRAAIAAGARGYFLWPGDRDALRTAIARPIREPEPRHAARGRLIAVHGVRGGVGTSTVALGLAAAWAGNAGATTLVDLDLEGADITPLVPIEAERRVRTFGDLLAVVEEFSARHAADIVTTHPAGFGVVLAAAPGAAASTTPAEVDEDAAATALDRLRTIGDVLAHVPRSRGAAGRVALAAADRIVLVVHADRASVRAARAFLDAGVGGDRVVAAITTFGSRGLGTREVERSLAVPCVTIPTDAAVRRAAERGRAAVAGTGARRAFARLAAALGEATA